MDKIDEELGFKPTRIIPLEKKRNPNAKEHTIVLTSKNFNDCDIEKMFTEYLKAMEPRFSKIKEVLKNTNGEIHFNVVF